MTSDPSMLRPDWPDLPATVRTATTERNGGQSRSPYDSLNLGLHVGDDPDSVLANRQRVSRALDLTQPPCWLHQVHGTDVVTINEASDNRTEADAAYTRQLGVPLCILTADCLPVLISSLDGAEIGAAHAGWRGLCDGVLENLVARFEQPARALTAWLGPAIGPDHFEVGPEVRDAFVARHTEAEHCFTPGESDRWLADIYALARQRLARLGVESVHGGGLCTVRDEHRFFSYRRDGATGRMAALIWRQGAPSAI